MKKLAEYFVESEQGHIRPQVGDSVDIVVNEELAIEADVLESTEDTLVLEYDERGISLLESLDLIEEQTPSQTDLDEGAMKDMMHRDAERMERKDFVEKYGEEHGEFWDNVMGDLDEAGCMSKKLRREDIEKTVEEEVAFHTALDSLMHRTFGEIRESNAITESPTQDAFEELKDYAETSGGIDKEEFEKAAYLVKAMGKSHLKDKAEGMLDELIGSMDSDPRDKVIQVLARHIDLTFLKNLFKTEDVELDEKYDSDKFFDGKGTPEQRTQLLKLQNKALKAFPSSPKQKEIKKEIDALRKKMGMKVKEEVELDEAEYQGRKVKLGKPMRGDVAKYKVYVKDKKTGNVKKVNFGDKNMEIKRDDPKRRKSFRARHGCGTPKASDRTKARYWSCRMWSSKPVSKII